MIKYAISRSPFLRVPFIKREGKGYYGGEGGEEGKDGEEKNNRAEVNRDVTENRSQFLFIDIETRRGEKKKGKSLFDGLY